MSSQTKTCTKCFNRKPLHEFYKDRRCADGRYSACKECARRAAMKWKRTNTERVAQYLQAYKQVHSDQTAQRMREWRARNKGRLRTYWARWNPLCNAKRRALKRSQLCDCCTPGHFAIVYSLARSLKKHVDHVRPIAKGGIHCCHNLQLLNPVENLRKGAKWEESRV